MKTRIGTVFLAVALCLSLAACNAKALILSGVEIAADVGLAAINGDASISPAVKAAYGSALPAFVNAITATATTCAGNGGVSMFQCLGSNLLPALQVFVNSGAAIKTPAEQAKINSYLGVVQTALNLIYLNFGIQAAPVVIPAPGTVADLELYRSTVQAVILEARQRHMPQELIVEFQQQQQ